MKIKNGSIFNYKRSGDHKNTELIVVHSDKINQRIVVNMDYRLQTGPVHLLYAEFTGRRLTKTQIKELKNEIGH